jgi:methyl-accepting chemotaxis protein
MFKQVNQTKIKIKKMTQPTFFKQLNLGQKIVVYIGGMFLVQLGVISGVFITSMSNNLLESNKKTLLTEINKIAQKIDQTNLEAINIPKTMAIAQEQGMFGNRQMSKAFAREVLASYPQFTGAYIGYEPNADRNDREYLEQFGGEGLDENGRFLPYWFRDNNNNIAINPLVDMETSLYYNGNKQQFLSGSQQKYMITEPYIYEGKLIVEQTYPIVINGQFKGVAGVDRALTDLNTFLSELKPYETADFILISRLGKVIVATHNRELETQEIKNTIYREIYQQFFVNDTLDNNNSEILTLRDPQSREKYLWAAAFIDTGDWKVMMRVSEAEIFNPIKWTIVKILLVIIIGATITLIVLFIIARSISNPLKQTVNFANQVASGDLTQNIVVNSEDEIGQLLRALNTMTHNLNSLMQNIQKSSIQVTTSATEIAATGKELEATMTQQLSSTHEVTATAQEIATTSTQLVKTMENVSYLAQNTAIAASEGQENLGQMETTMGQLSEATNSIASKLGTIREKANNISSVVITITKVADQTNLLSLNAAIEAEKAGQYGAGFAVVAREIRRLADQTAVATLEIEQMVKEMQSAVSTGVMEMDKFSQEVTNNVTEVGRISEQIAQVIQQVQSLKPQFDQVSHSMEEQAHSAQQINLAMVQLSEASQQTSESLRDTNQALSNLDQAAQELQAEITVFKI